MLLPLLQEITDFKSDTGSADTAEDVRTMLRGLFAEEEVGFDVGRIDVSAVREGWNWKESGYWEYERGAIERRAGDLRGVLFGCGEDEEVSEIFYLLISTGDTVVFLVFIEIRNGR